MPGRHAVEGKAYRYGFQGQEKDDEVKGEGNSLNYTFRMHDPRVGRFFAIDPLAPEYPWNSPYAFSENRVIASIELEGLEAFDLSGATPEFGPQPENSNATVYGPYTEEGAYDEHTMGTFQLDEVAIEGKVKPGEVDGRQVILESARLLGGSEKFDKAVINTYNQTLNQPAGIRWQCIAGTALMAEKMETGGWLGSSISWGGGAVSSEVSTAARAVRSAENSLPKTVNLVPKLCFVEGTLVSTECGLFKIEDVNIGDKVWSCNEETREIELEEVLNLSSNIAEELIEIQLKNEKILCTSEHPFFTNDYWKEAKYLQAGDQLKSKNGEIVKVLYVKSFRKKTNVYNFEVKNNHNYYVSSLEILVHNNCDFLNALKNFANNTTKNIKHINEHFFAGDINIGGLGISQMFKKGMTRQSVINEALELIKSGKGVYGKSNQGAKEVILDFGRFINEANNTSKVRIWLEVAKDGSYNVRSIHPRT